MLAVSAAPTELLIFLCLFTQGFISGFALIPPWALQECRPKGLFCDKLTLRLVIENFIKLLINVFFAPCGMLLVF